MGKLVYYVAQSADGYIARKNGKVDWLENYQAENYGYQEFLDEVEAVIMGNTTYKQILSFKGPFPYKDKDVFVLTSRVKNPRDENAVFICRNVVKYIKKIKKVTEGICWLIGGGKTAAYLLQNNLIDEIRVFTMPIVLGSGIPFLGEVKKESQLELVKSQTYKSGVVELVYELSK